MEELDRGIARKSMLTIWFIWGAIFMSLAVYVIVCHLAVDGLKSNINPDFPMENLKKILFGVAVIEFVISCFLRKFMIRAAQKTISKNSDDTPSVTNSRNIIQKYMVIVLICIAISESIGIYGVVVFFMSLDYQALYTFIIFSAAAMFFHRPSAGDIETLTGK